MSTAARFLHHRPFPFCESDAPDPITPGAGVEVTGLSLTTVMAFFWNLESITFTTTGAITATDPNTGANKDIAANGSFIMSPFALSGDWSTFDYPEVGDSASSGLYHVASPGETSRQPVDRVCLPYATVLFHLVSTTSDSSATFAMCILPDTGSLWKVKMIMNFEFSPWLHPSLFFSDSFQANAIASGTFDLGMGLVFPWFSSWSDRGYTVSGSPTGTLTASASYYTY